MGAHFTHPAFSSTWAELDTFRARTGTRLFAADAEGRNTSSVTPAPRVTLVVGNEGAGLSKEARERADLTIAIPLSPGVESLNVAVATAVLLYLLSR